MMRRLMGVLGVDYVQWRALTRTMIRVDLREAGNIVPSSGGRRSTQKQVLLTQGMFYGITGLFLAALALLPDVFMGGMLMISVVMFLVGAMVLIEYQSVVISPDDHHILGFQPLSSRTYFAVKLTNVFIYVNVIATFLAGPSIITHLIRGGPFRGVAAMAAAYGATAFITLAMVVAYAMVLRFIHPKRLRRALSYLQMLLGIVMYGGYALFPRLIDRDALTSLEAGEKTWILLYPPSWFASFLEISAGHYGVAEVLPALAAVVSVGLLFWYSTEKLSLSYAKRLAGLVSVSETPAKPTAGGDDPRHRPPYGAVPARRFRLWPAPRGEARAVGLLIRAQFRYDMKFRMAVIGIVPITLLYLFMSLSNGTLPDPFVDPDFGGMQGLGLLHLAMVLLPVMLLENVAASDSFRAAWVYFATPADRSRLIVAAKNIIVAFVVVPYLLFVGGIFTWFFDSLLHAFVHVAVLALIANLVLQSVVRIRPQLPFARPLQKGQRSNELMVFMILAIVGTIGLLPFLLSYAYASPARIVAAVGALLVANVLLGRSVRRHAEQRTARLEFAA